MTVPGGSHDQEQGDEKQNSLQHRYRHEKRSNERQKFAGLYTGPYFDPAMPNNISVQLGDTALLICKVNQVGRKTVSQIWAFYANIDISHHGLLYDLEMEGFKWPLFFSQKGDKISNLSYSQLKKVSKEIVSIC